MIKKIFTIACALNLITAFSIFGMEHEIYPCDSCHQEKEHLYFFEKHNNHTRCTHILCQECRESIWSTLQQLLMLKNMTIEEMTTLHKSDVYHEFHQDRKLRNSRCDYCSYFCTQHKKQCWVITDPEADPEELSRYTLFKEITTPEIRESFPDRVLPDINPEVTQTIDNATTKNTPEEDKTIAEDIETYPCDNCLEEKSQLTVLTSGVCNHIVCAECLTNIDKIKQPAWWKCHYCAYFFNEKNKLCWKRRTHEDFRRPNIHITQASGIRRDYPNRILPDATNEALFETLLPENPDNPNNQNNPNNPGNPNNPPIQNSTFVINKKIKWFGAVCVAGIVCFGAYKVYSWWKGEDIKEEEEEEEENNGEQENTKKEEHITS